MASGLVLHCLPMSHKKNDMLIWVKYAQTGTIIMIVIKSVPLIPYKSSLCNSLVKGLTYEIPDDGICLFVSTIHRLIKVADDGCNYIIIIDIS